MYALKYKKMFDFICVSDSPEIFEEKINSSFMKWKGIQARGNNATIDDFLSPFEKVIVTVVPYNVLLCRAGPGNTRKHGALSPASARAAC